MPRLELLVLQRRDVLEMTLLARHLYSDDKTRDYDTGWHDRVMTFVKRLNVEIEMEKRCA